MHRHFVAAAMLMTASVVAAPIPKTTELPPEKIAERTAESFIKALQDKDAAAVKKLVDVPYRKFRGDTNSLETRKEVDRELEQLAEDNKLPGKTVTVIGAYKVDKLIEYADKKRGEKSSDNWAKNLRELIQEDEWAVVVEVKEQAPKRRTAAVLVRVKDGEGRVTGLIE